MCGCAYILLTSVVVIVILVCIFALHITIKRLKRYLESNAVDDDGFPPLKIIPYTHPGTIMSSIWPGIIRTEIR